MDTAHRPDQCPEDEKYIDRREHITSETELQRRECNIEEEIEGKWQCDDPGDLLPPRHHEDGGKGHEDSDIQHGPYGTKDRCRRSPERLDELLIPNVGLHEP